MTAEELVAATAELSHAETKETDLIAKDKPDEMDLAGARKRLSSVSTAEKIVLPTAEDIKSETEAKAAAETALQEGKETLKPVETTERQRLPTVDDINAEQSAELEATEILTEAKKRLSATTPEVKQSLPSTADIEAEKKDKDCAISSSSQMAKAAESKAKAEQQGKSLGSVDHKSLMVGGAGAGGGFGLNAPGYGVKVTHFAGGGSGVAAKKQIDISADIANAWTNVMSDESKTSWLYCKYSDNMKELSLQATGEGGLSEFKQQVGESMAWGAFRCYGVDKRGGTEVRRTKFVFVQVRPEGVNMVKKSKQATHKGDVKSVITNTHLDVAVETIADLDEQGLITKLQAATGAHKPNGYEFDVGNFIEADYYGLGIGKDCKGETAAS